MSLLRDSPEDFIALASAAQIALGIPDPGFVEKDYWVIELLRSVTKPLTLAAPRSAEVLFKGGTSLSKAFGVIDRFSEDVDILVICEGMGSSARENQVLWPICERAGNDLARSDDDIERLGYKSGWSRNVLYRYRPLFNSPGIQSAVKLEMGIRGGTLPGTVFGQVRSYIAEYVATNGIAADFDELAPVTVNLIAPVRTLAEKCALLHHAGTLAAAGDSRSLEMAGRHFYDVARLLANENVQAMLTCEGSRMFEIAPDVDRNSEENGWGFTARPDDGYAASVVFASSGAVSTVAARAFDDARGLMWGQVPTFDECLAMIKAQGHSL